MLEVGKKAPAFKLPAADGSTKSLKDYKGQKAVDLVLPERPMRAAPQKVVIFETTTMLFPKRMSKS